MESKELHDATCRAIAGKERRHIGEDQNLTSVHPFDNYQIGLRRFPSKLARGLIFG